MPRVSACKVSSSDKAKLDEYLTSVREVEKRIERMRNDKDKAEDHAKKRGRPSSPWNARKTGCRKICAITRD